MNNIITLQNKIKSLKRLLLDLDLYKNEIINYKKNLNLKRNELSTFEINILHQKIFESSRCFKYTIIACQKLNSKIKTNINILNSNDIEEYNNMIQRYSNNLIN